MPLINSNTRQRILFYLSWAARFVVVVVFIAAAIPKIIHPNQFAQAIANYQIFPYWSWNLIAAIVPMIELVASIALLFGWKRHGAMVVLLGLTFMFMLLIVSALVRDLNVECGCFGQAQAGATIGWPLFWRDLGLFGLILLAGFRPKSKAG